MVKQINNPDFGNWVPAKMIVVPGIIGAVCTALGFVHWAFIIPALLFLAIAGYFTFSRYLFSTGGKNVQGQVQDLLLSHINWSGQGRALDIGCGNGPLTIRLAKRYPEAQITGVDFWGKDWDYSMQICYQNAKLAGVDRNIAFKKASASKLPFENNSFEIVVSNLVFHEVRDVKDKRESIREALRVLKPGGIFVLQDLFLLTNYYGTSKELTETIESWGVKQVNFIQTCDEPFLPKLTKLPFMLGTLALLKGVK